MSAQRKRELTIHSKERNTIVNVIKRCDEEAEQKYFSVPITKATARSAKYFNLSSRTIQHIRYESNNCVVDGEFSTPGKTRKSPNVRNAEEHDFDRRVIKDGIEDFYLGQKVVPTCKMLLPVLKERIDSDWKVTTLRRILKEMYFKWKRCGSRRKILIERENILNWRCA
jgi:hypothetical protein